MNNENKEYILSDIENKYIYNREIEPYYFNELISTNSPKIFILCGQPGSGKTEFIQKNKNQMFINDNFCNIDIDDFRKFHPKYDEILKFHEKYYTNYTKYDAKKWNDLILYNALQNKFNIIYECTMREDDIYNKIFDLYTSNYKIYIIPLSVNFFVSLYSILYRYIENKKNNNNPRFVNLSIHREAYIKMIENLGNISESLSYESINIYGRDFTNIYSYINSDEDIISTIEEYRNKFFVSDLNIYLFQSKYHNLIKDIKRYGDRNILQILYDEICNFCYNNL